MKKFLYLCFAFIFVLLANNISFSQNDTNNNSSGKEIRKIVRQKLMEKLNVDDKTINSYLIVYAEYRKKDIELNKQKAALVKYIEDNTDALDISQKMDDLLNIQTKIIDARRDYIEKAKKILTPQQLAKAIVFQKKLRKIMNTEKE
jgi:predicted metal-dependent phosphoesterase TrpH